MFEVECQDSGGARVGVLSTSHGAVETPLFLPVATHGAVKTLTFPQLRELGYPAFISNAFVLYLKPGVKVIREAGGLHSFLGWSGVVFTDSGGYQMLNPEFMEGVGKKGVVFRSPFDRSRHVFTPELCMEVQNELGADVALTLDALVAHDQGLKEQEEAVRKTLEWAERCRKAHSNASQLLFAITQGGTDERLRKRCALKLVEMGFDGYAIGGLSIGEPKELMHQVLSEQVKLLPCEKPRYLMGVGSPLDMLRCIESGVDIFDSSFPTRNARHGLAYTFSGELQMDRGRFREDERPIENGCPCYTCRSHSRAYVHHLLKANEAAGKTLMTIHNLSFIARLLEAAKQAIREDRLSELKGSLSRVLV